MANCNDILLTCLRESCVQQTGQLNQDSVRLQAAVCTEELYGEVERLTSERSQWQVVAMEAGRVVQNLQVEIERLKGLLESAEQCLRYLREQAGVEADDIRVVLAEEDS